MPLSKIPSVCPIQAPPTSSFPLQTGLYAHFDARDPFSIEKRYPTSTDSSARRVIRRWLSPVNYGNVYYGHEGSRGLDYRGNYVNSDSIGDYLGAVDTLGTIHTSFTFIIVVYWGSNVPLYLGTTDPSARTKFILYPRRGGGSDNRFIVQLAGSTAVSFEYPQIPRLDTVSLLTITCGTDESSLALRSNGNVVPTPTPTVASNTTAFQFGKPTIDTSNFANDTSGLTYNPNYYEIALFDRVLTPAELTSVESHLISKWSITT